MNVSEFVCPLEVPSRRTKTTILWGSENVFLDSVELFLKTAGWQVTKLASECGEDYLIQRARSLEVEVVILCQEREGADPRFLMRLSQVESCAKVVVLNMESNFVRVYARGDVMLNGVSDLLSVVDHEFFTAEPSTEVPGHT